MDTSTPQASPSVHVQPGITDSSPPNSNGTEIAGPAPAQSGETTSPAVSENGSSASPGAGFSNGQNGGSFAGSRSTGVFNAPEPVNVFGEILNNNIQNFGQNVSLPLGDIGDIRAASNTLLANRLNEPIRAISDTDASFLFPAGAPAFTQPNRPFLFAGLAAASASGTQRSLNSPPPAPSRAAVNLGDSFPQVAGLVSEAMPFDPAELNAGLALFLESFDSGAKEELTTPAATGWTPWLVAAAMGAGAFELSRQQLAPRQVLLPALAGVRESRTRYPVDAE